MQWGRLGGGLLAVTLAACQLAPAGSTATPAPLQAVATPVVVTTAAPSTTPPRATAAPTATSAALPATAVPEPLRPAYALTATVDLFAHTVAVSASVRFAAPAADQAVFNFNPLQSAGLAVPLTAWVDSVPVSVTIDGMWVTVPFPAARAVGEPVTVDWAYTLNLLEINPFAWGWRGTLGYTTRQLNLGDWYPALAPYQSGGWLTPAPTALGEYAMTPAADYTVRFSLVNAEATPFVAGSGTPQACAPAWCFSLMGGRYLAYVVSSAMLTATLQTRTGVTVTSVYLPEHAAAGQAAAHTAAQALDIYSELFGPYPYPQYVQVEGDFYDGMEYSALSYVGASYYAEYDNTPRNLVSLIGAHEVAHQWWYSLVGSDQAHEPWLDEALAIYAELLYMQRQNPSSVDWWWTYRVDAFGAEGPVNSTIYDYQDFRGYVDAVYLRGAEMLRAMQATLGDEQFLAFLRAYAQQQSGRIATGADFWAAYTAAGGDAQAIQAEYFAP